MKFKERRHSFPKWEAAGTRVEAAADYPEYAAEVTGEDGCAK